MSDALKVGDTIWHFDQNRRVYTNPDKGRLWGSIIYAEHWHEQKIEGETTRSWLVGPFRKKVPKKGPHHGWAFSHEEVQDDLWLNDHRYKIEREVSKCRDVKKLRAIAGILGEP